MNKLGSYISRPHSILTGKTNLEPLFVFRDLPIFMGCTDTPYRDDVVADMDWGICPQSGCIQLRRLVPLDSVYLNQHNDGVWKIWQDLYAKFVAFLLRFAHGARILEIGGAHDVIARNYLQHRPEAQWTIVEPNPQHIRNSEVHIVPAWFDGDFRLSMDTDTVVHSHVLEHTYEPQTFLKDLATYLKPGRRHIFAVPNLQPMLENKFTNCLNFEHNVFLTEHFIDWLLARSGFKILAKEYYATPHSILYATERIAEPKSQAPLESRYSEYKKLFREFVRYHEEMIVQLNAKLDTAKVPVYLFGAHIFSIYLINFGLHAEKIISVLDNSSLKQSRRLYGTQFIVESSKVLAGKGPVNVIVRAGIYNEEIKNDIHENINREVTFW